MTDLSNIRKLLCDEELGLIPHLEKCLKDLHTSFKDRFKLESYDFELGNCHTHKLPNEQKPLVTQLVLMKFSLYDSWYEFQYLHRENFVA